MLFRFGTLLRFRPRFTMPRPIVSPHALDFDSPARRYYYLAIEHAALWGWHLVPLSVWAGPRAKEGQGAVARGSRHGTEYEGRVALKQLLGELDIADVTGRVTIIPVLNVEPLRTGT